jgi:alpha-ketoglutarate-dependent taurine dioxygenase
MEIHHLSPFGIEVRGLEDLSAATPAQVRSLFDAMVSDAGCGVLVVRAQHLPPAALERTLHAFGAHFGAPIRYDRWPGQSKGVEGHPHLSLLGNYRARRDGDLGVACVAGERIGEYKPAIDAIEEWHTDGSFLAAPKAAVALYAPRDLTGALPAEGGATRFASCARAFDALPPEERAALHGLGSVHSWELFMRLLEARDPAHPKVARRTSRRTRIKRGHSCERTPTPAARRSTSTRRIRAASSRSRANRPRRRARGRTGWSGWRQRRARARACAEGARLGRLRAPLGAGRLCAVG